MTREDGSEDLTGGVGEGTRPGVAEVSPPENLQALLARLESDSAPTEEYHFHTPFNRLRRAREEQGQAVQPELFAEELAFAIHAHDHQEPSVWGLYFGPMMSGTTATGERWDSPPLAAVSREVLDYWRRRAAATPHAIMRARYADLLWELPKSIEGETPDATYARMAVDAYLDAVQQKRFESAVNAIAKGKRALDVALSLKDADRAERARDLLLDLEDSVAEDDSLGLWGFCFDLFVAPSRPRVTLAPEQTSNLVSQLEERLARFVARPPSEYHPAGAEEAAMRLANYYRRMGRKGEAARVLRAYAEVVARMRGSAAPLVYAHSLERLYNLLKSFELHADADGLNASIREAGAEAVADMKVISATAEIPREKVERFFEAMLEGDASLILNRMAVHFVPKRSEVEHQVQDLASKAPISFLMIHSITDGEGRTIARVGPLDTDLEGHVLLQMAQNLAMGTFWLRETIRRGMEEGVLCADAFMDHLLACPLFLASRRPILRRGIDAYVEGDAFSAIHLLVPQVEQALRQLAVALGAPIYTQRRGGGFHARTLDDLLRDQALGDCLGVDVVTYFRVLLTDARGWNIRNDVCHGLAPSEALTMAVADRVLHALLVLALLRLVESQPPTSEDASERA